MSNKQDRLLDIMKQGFMKPRKYHKALPYRLTPLLTGKRPGIGTGLLYEIYTTQGNTGMIGRTLGSPTPNFYVVVDGNIVSEGHRTAAQAAKWFSK